MALGNNVNLHRNLVNEVKNRDKERERERETDFIKIIIHYVCKTHYLLINLEVIHFPVQHYFPTCKSLSLNE